MNREKPIGACGKTKLRHEQNEHRRRFPPCEFHVQKEDQACKALRDLEEQFRYLLRIKLHTG